MLDSIKKKDEKQIFYASNAQWRFGFLAFLVFIMVAIVSPAIGIVLHDIEGVFVGIIGCPIFGYCLNQYIRIGKARKRWREISKEMKEIENQLT